MKSLDEYLMQAAKDGSVRSGMILGIRMSLMGLDRLGIKEIVQKRRSLVTIVETDRCLPDAVEMVTGCRLGNRTLKFRDLGKMAATFVDLNTMLAVRLAVRESANARALEMSPHLDREEALKTAYRSLLDEELFGFGTATVRLFPEEIPGYWAPRVICEDCGEGVGFGRQVVQNGRKLCRSCANALYLEPSGPLCHSQ